MAPSLLSKSASRESGEGVFSSLLGGSGNASNASASGVGSTTTRSYHSGGHSSANNRTSVGGECYEPRRSNRVTKTFSHDGDIWQENLAVCEASGNRLVIRSYFRNTRTGKKAWDEPPTGATHIEPASTLMRKQADEQLKELSLAVQGRKKKNVPRNVEKQRKVKEEKKNGVATGASGLLRKIQSDKNATVMNKAAASNKNAASKALKSSKTTTQKAMTSNKNKGSSANNNMKKDTKNGNNPGTKKGFFSGIVGPRSSKKQEQQQKEKEELLKKRQKQRAEQEEKYLEKAIALSLKEQNTNGNIKNNGGDRKKKRSAVKSPRRKRSVADGYREDEEALQLAMMLSMSEADKYKNHKSKKQSSPTTLTKKEEDVLLTRALEESRVDAILGNLSSSSVQRHSFESVSHHPEDITSSHQHHSQTHDDWGTVSESVNVDNFYAQFETKVPAPRLTPTTTASSNTSYDKYHIIDSFDQSPIPHRHLIMPGSMENKRNNYNVTSPSAQLSHQSDRIHNTSHANKSTDHFQPYIKGTSPSFDCADTMRSIPTTIIVDPDESEEEKLRKMRATERNARLARRAGGRTAQ